MLLAMGVVVHLHISMHILTHTTANTSTLLKHSSMEFIDASLFIAGLTVQ